MTNPGERMIQATDTRSIASVLSGVFAILLGAFLVLGAGFSPISAIHNATHDTRHTIFPCH
jgi:cobalt transporter subunit CbtB